MRLNIRIIEWNGKELTYSLRASPPINIWACEASLVSLARCGETLFARPNRRACSQANEHSVTFSEKREDVFNALRGFPEERSHQIVIVFKSCDSRVTFSSNQNFIIVNFFGKTLIHL